MSTATVANNRMRRRLLPLRLQVRLRTILAGVAVLCALLARQMNRVHREQHAIRTLTSHGIQLALASSAPDWLPDALDGPWFQYVAAANLIRDDNAEELESWGRHSREVPLSNLEIYFYVCPYQNVAPLQHPPILTEGWLPVVGAFGDCKVLLLGGSPIGDAGLKHLKRLSKLQYLDLSDTQITDEAIVELMQMQSLAGLNLRGTHVSNDAIGRLRRVLPDCQISK